MAFATIEDTDGTVDVTIFPEPFKAAAGYLRSRDALLISGKVDDTDKGRVVLAEQVRLLEHAVAAGVGRPVNGAAQGVANAYRVRLPANSDAAALVGAVRQACGEHVGAVPLFLHVPAGSVEVVVRATALCVDAGAELTGKLETLLGPGAVTVEHAGRA
jgi:hypothetical protein